MEYVHLKSGYVYEVLTMDATNKTTPQDGQKMVIYIGERRDGSNKKGIYVRELEEFNEKFVPKK